RDPEVVVPQAIRIRILRNRCTFPTLRVKGPRLPTQGQKPKQTKLGWRGCSGNLARRKDGSSQKVKRLTSRTSLVPGARGVA
ncbi:unnamed protein product, partial [Amoebophrya sp. A120]